MSRVRFKLQKYEKASGPEWLLVISGNSCYPFAKAEACSGQEMNSFKMKTS